MDKAVLRKQFRAKRTSINFLDEFSRCACEAILNSSYWKSAETLLLYQAIGSEVNTDLLIEEALKQNKQLLLPVTLNKDGDMGVGKVTQSTVLSDGYFSIPEPEHSSEFDVDSIDLILVPGVVFDLNGGRIGQGGGYYDRFLSTSQATKIGFCYHCQIADFPIPMNDHDIRMDIIVTEKEVIQCGG